jgi:hypothetical protein
MGRNEHDSMNNEGASKTETKKMPFVLRYIDLFSIFLA